MRDHLDPTLQEAAHQLCGDYPGSVADYDAVETEIRAMADMLSRGIIKQFLRSSPEYPGRDPAASTAAGSHPDGRAR